MSIYIGVMLKRVFVLLVVGVLSVSCAYKTTQSQQFSKLLEVPLIVENKNNYELILKQPQDRNQLIYSTNPIIAQKAQKEDFVMRFSKKQSRLFVGLQVADSDAIKLSNRRIYLKKTPNFRDMGGIKTQQGKTIVWGKIFRSGHLNGLSKGEIKKVQDLGIGSIVDLRTSEETNKKPDRYPDSTRYFNYNAFEQEQDQLIKTRKAVFKGTISADESIELLKAFYGYYPTENTEIISEIIKTLLDQDHAVLFHCSAGKDRTGMIGALILSILKVDRETIDQEYLLSNNYRQKSIEKQLRWIPIGRLLYPSLNQEVVENFSWINTDYLQAAFDQIDVKYGSMDLYIKQALHISDSERQAYIDKFTY